MRCDKLPGNCTVAVLACLCSVAGWGQIPKNATVAGAPASEAPKDPLGRTTPRGAVLGFLNAARKGEDKLAVLYLNTPKRGATAAALAQQLAVVLDRRLPARLQRLSDQPEGSQLDPLNPNRDLVGTISSANGEVDIYVERVDRGKLGTVWLFANESLGSIPELFKEVRVISVDGILPGFLVRNRFAGIPLYEWLALFVGIPLLYLATTLVNRLLGAVVGWARRRLLRQPDRADPKLLPVPVRILVVALMIYAVKYNIGLTLLARQFCASLAAMLTIVSCVWILLICNAQWEAYAHRRLARRNQLGASSVVRLVRGALDVLFIFLGLLVGLKYFRLNVSAALAGLGVGGIAVALAAQKTLENVLGGVSIIVDDVVHVGDFLKVGDTVGMVEEIGLRSTRIRTSDRTLISIPNGQVANVSVENFSARDKFWLHHFVGLRYDTTAAQLRAVVEGMEGVLTEHRFVEKSSARVKFLRFGAFSLDLEIFAYIFARDFVQFLEVQNELLLRLMEVVQTAGTEIALQTPVLATNTPEPEANAPKIKASVAAALRRRAS